MPFWKHWLFLLGVIGNLAMSPAITTNQFVSNGSATYTFGENISFSATFDAPEKIRQLLLYIEPEGQNVRIVNISGDFQDEIQIDYDLRTNPIPPFSNVRYWFQANLEDQSVLNSEHYEFNYFDNRFEWRELNSDHFKIFWTSSDVVFGQMVLNVAELSLQNIGNILLATQDKPIVIFVYDNPDELQSALQLAQASWSAAHADPNLGVILVSKSVNDQQKMLFERQIPHELMHIVEYQNIGDHGYQQQPQWLIEGLASYAELYPNPEYKRVIENNIDNNSLIPLSNLCDTFPPDAETAYLAYAESESFVRYLIEQQGTSSIKALFQAYSDGSTCAEGIQSTYHQTLEELENRWKIEVLGISSLKLFWQNLNPYILLSFLILIPPLIIGLLLIRKRPNKGINHVKSK